VSEKKSGLGCGTEEANGEMVLINADYSVDHVQTVRVLRVHRQSEGRLGCWMWSTRQ
jgi:hypothetical protein